MVLYEDAQAPRLRGGSVWQAGRQQGSACPGRLVLGSPAPKTSRRLEFLPRALQPGHGAVHLMGRPPFGIAPRHVMFRSALPARFSGSAHKTR